MDMESLHGLGGNNNAVDDIIRNYTVSADGNINAGDLCEFINGQVRKTFKTTVSTNDVALNSVASMYSVSEVLDSTHVIVFYAGVSTYLWAVVLTIVDHSTISIGALTQLTSVATVSIATTLINPYKILISYQGASGYLNSAVVTVDGDTITLGTPSVLNAVSSTAINSKRLDTNRVLLTYRATSGYLFTIVLIIKNNAIYSFGAILQTIPYSSTVYDVAVLTPTTAVICYVYSTCTYYSFLSIVDTLVTVQVGGVSLIGRTPSALELLTIDSTHVFVQFVDSSNNFLSSGVLVISGTTLYTKIFEPVYSCGSFLDIKFLNEDKSKILIVYAGASPYYMYARVINIVEYEQVFGTPIQLNSLPSYYNSISVIDEKHAIVSFRNNTSTYLSAVHLGIDGTTVSKTVITHDLSPKIIAQSSAISGNLASFLIKGTVKELSGLVPNSEYYCDDSGNLTKTVTDIRIGVALSNTELLVDKAWWER